MDEPLRHTNEVDAILAEGGREAIKAAKRKHTAHVDRELARAQAGETINLSDLMAAKEQIDLADDR